MRSTLRFVIPICAISLLVCGCQKDIPPSFPSPPTADAGNNQTIQLPSSSVTLTGSGTTTNGFITGYLWSLISGPNVPVIASPSSAITSIAGFVAGTYKFQFMVTDNAGLVGIDTTSIIFNPASIQTLTLQPANNNDERHLWGNSQMDQSGHATELVAATWTSGSTIFVRGAFKFNLSSIPSSATILTAKLSLYSNPSPLNGNQTVPNEGSNNAMFIRRIASNWIPASTFWLTQPSTTAVDQVPIAHTNLPALDLIDIDVKNLVAAMHTNGNYGFMIQLQNESPYNMRNFCSSINSLTSKHPKLVITYQ